MKEYSEFATKARAFPSVPYVGLMIIVLACVGCGGRAKTGDPQRTGNESPIGRSLPGSESIDRADFWFTGIGANGEVEWERSVRGAFPWYYNNASMTADHQVVFVDGPRRDDPNEIRLMVFDSTLSHFRERKYRPFGEIGERGAIAMRVLSLEEGGFLLAGVYGAKQSHVWLCRISAETNLVWAQSYTIPPLDLYLGGIAQTAGGGCILAGTARGRQHQKAWLMQISSEGDREWMQLYGDSSSVKTGDAVTMTMEGHIVLVGTIATKNGRQRGETEGWMLSATAAGVVEWEMEFPGTVIDTQVPELQGSMTLHAVCQGSDGSYVAAGSDHQDFVLVKVSRAGGEMWRRRYGTNAEEWCTVLQCTRDGGFILCGDSDADDLFIVRTDPAGDARWRFNIGGSGSEFPGGIWEMPDASFLLAGTRTSESMRSIHPAAE